MPGAARRIERLRLTAAAEEGLTRGRVLIEDAFRIASFPGDAERRLLVIRKLELGLVDPDRSSAALAPAIEEAVRAATGRAVRFDDPAARAADVVFFPDALSPFCAVVERFAEAAPPTEWFWDAVLEGRVPAGDPEAGGRLALDRLLDSPDGAVRVVLVLATLRARATVDRFLGWLQPADAGRMLAALGVDATPHRHGAPAPEAINQGVDEAAERPSRLMSAVLRPWRSVLVAWTARWGQGDPRSRWLALAALVSTQPSLLAHADLPALTRRLLRAARHSPAATGPPPTLRPAEALSQPTPRGHDVTTALVENADPVREAVSLPYSTGSAAGRVVYDAAVVRPYREGIAGGRASAFDRADAREAAGVEPPEQPAAAREGDLLPTAAAGLLFLLPLLSRLRIDEVLARNSVLVEAEFPVRLLGHIAHRVRVADRDPVRAPLVPTGLAPRPSRFTYLAPAAWRAHGGVVLIERGADGVERRAWTDRSGRVVYALWREQPPAALADAGLPPVRPSTARHPAPDDWDRVLGSWLTRVRRAVHRFAGMGLHALVARAGWVAATRTHIDVVLPLRDLDVRVRRAGFDVDPGWVPWLGRVVGFHYEGGP